MNIIPKDAGKTPSYYCTWGAQNAIYSADYMKNPQKYAGGQGAHVARDNMNDEAVFGENGMAHQYDKIRGDLYFVLDDGWDVPYDTNPSTHRHEFGSLLLNEDRFPSCAGTPEVRLQKINDKLKALGWKGAGLWIASQAQGEKAGSELSKEQAIKYWTERLIWSQKANIEYWKVDWGLHDSSVEFRRMLTQLGKSVHPGLLIEQARCMGCTNDNNGRFDNWENITKENLDIFSFSDVFRSYDVWDQLSAVATLDRLAVLLQGQLEDNALGIINCEDELYLGAALGCSIGIMRNRFNQRKVRRLDEAIRAVRWQRLAPAFGAGVGNVNISPETNYDSWYFKDGETYDVRVNNSEIKQGAPQAITRGVKLPTIEGSTTPFVVAAKNPSGALSVATLPRSIVDHKKTPLCRIELDAKTPDVPIGIFGYYGQLVLNFDASVEGKKVFAQDLAGDVAEDVTCGVKLSNNQLTIPGELITKIGLSCASKDDKSEPGLVVVLK